MIIRELSKVKNAVLHDAILVATYQKHSFVSVYVDPNKECAITFLGELPEKDIQLFFANLNPDTTCAIEDEKIEYNIDYTYYDGRTKIYTRIGYKYE